MELNELTHAWNAWDTRLKKNELLGERIIREMLQQKTTRSLGQLIGWDAYGLFVAIAGIPFLIYMWMAKAPQTLLIGIMLGFALLGCVIGLILRTYRMWQLQTVDPVGSVARNLACVQKFNVCYLREQVAERIIRPIVFAMIIAAGFSLGNRDVWAWTFVIACLAISIPVSYLVNKHIYKANIRSILESLEELKDLRSEE